MAKKTSNPADAFRKAQRAKELRKNKEERKKVRETQTIKRDTRELEADIRQLKTQTDAASKTRLKELETELEYVNSLKEKFVTDHPEARDKVFRTHKPREEGEGSTSAAAIKANLYDEQGRLRDPKKSVYYDAVYNPFGVPPPGMPYRERTPEDDSEESEEDSDDEIVMPEGPPPEATREGSGSDSDSDGSDDSDDIPLPEGPPPPKPVVFTPALPAGPVPPPMRMGFGFGAPPMPFRPPPRPVPLHAHATQYNGQGGFGPGYPGGTGAGPSNFRPPIPRPPRQNIHDHNRPPPVVQDPLSDAPTQTYQGHRMAQHALPPRPPVTSSTDQPASPAPGASAASAGSAPAGAGAGSGSAEISAAPVLRDLRKEATVFVPRGVKRKKVLGGGPINAAPGAGEIDEDGDERKRVDSGGSGLMGKLEGLLGGPATVPAGTSTRTQAAGTGGGGDDDYQKFLEGLGDLA